MLANAPAEADVNAVDIWDINGYESVYYEYARFNTNVTNLYAPNQFRSSDHSPEIIGINAAPTTGPVDVQILGTNDFHGRLLNDTGAPFPNECRRRRPRGCGQAAAWRRTPTRCSQPRVT